MRFLGSHFDPIQMGSSVIRDSIVFVIGGNHRVQSIVSGR